MTHERKLIIGLSLTVFTLLGLTGAWVLALNWHWLGVASLLFGLFYPLVWLAYRCFDFWQQSIMRLTTYSQVLQEGIHNINISQQNPDNLLSELKQSIDILARAKQHDHKQAQTVQSLLGNILDSWTVPICLFDSNLRLTYRNKAMNEQILQPMLNGTQAQDLGFEQKDQRLEHPIFDHRWQTQTINYQYQGEKHWLFSALDISNTLHQNQSITQQNLIRVLSHELRNSLTPMASMADTLLSNDTINEAQVRLVLTRIMKRSNGLLDFIGSYSQLMQLPKPQPDWFDMGELISEAQSMIPSQCTITRQGEEQCFGDRQQLSQVFINLFKNASESQNDPPVEIKITLYQRQQNQIIEVTDNGPGFANLDNVLTPFYTTKTNGSGIGLSLCAEIVNHHGGQLSVANLMAGDAVVGAKVLMRWPIP
ncbi:MAG: GHKL domain-containing protein [Algicola sp.]|nr:GHKL domain-containing protein [Algicola sp.]